MSLPKIPDINPKINLTREDSINILIASVALEEMALAHILNAEGEKIQYVLGTLDGNKPKDVTVCDVMNVNESVNKTLRNVVATEMLLLFKLEDAIGLGGSEECRKNLTIKKIWNDAENAHNTRPVSVEITLMRDGEKIDTATLTAAGNWTHIFKCLLVGNGSVQYEYTIDETTVPAGYLKSVNGYNITNVLEEITVSGTKTWEDNHNAARPATITINILQNGVLADSLELAAPPAGEDTAKFEFPNIPFADDDGKPFVYTVTEEPVTGYTTTIVGFNITNTIITRSFSFNKTSTATGLSLQGAIFEIRQNGVLISSSTSDAAGKVSFSNLLPGSYQMAETQPPVGYMDNKDIYEVVISSDGGVTIGGMPAEQFSVKNQPEILIRRATAVAPTYMAAPNTWALHGTGTTDLYMVDKILITTTDTPVLVKWEYGVKDVSYFSAGGGIDVTASYTSGIPTYTNGDYTVYLKFGDGFEVAITITIDNIRDGSTALPYLLIDYSTANALEPSVTGISQYVLGFMQGGGVKLSQHYEVYENIDMTGKSWTPLGTTVAQSFTGSLYGNGHDIENMSVTTSSGSNTGMFAHIADPAVIENLGFVNCIIKNTAGQAAGIVGYVYANNGGTTILRDLTFSGSVTASALAGGIAAYVNPTNGSAIIDSCSVNGAVSGGNVGGIAGFSIISLDAAEVTINNCYTEGSVTGTGEVGGILGASSTASDGLLKIENCVNTMTVLSSSLAGGIIGYGGTSSNGTAVVSSCLNRGEVNGNSYVGGIAGELNSTNPADMMTIENCYNSAKITAGGTSNTYAGGIVGICYYYIAIKNSYNTGSVMSQNNVGGVGGNHGNVENCAAINERSSSLQSNVARVSQTTAPASQSALSNNHAFDDMRVLIAGVQKTPLDIGVSGTDGISETAASIKTQALYETTLGWDFTSVWSFGNGAYTLPVLRGIPASLQPDVLPPHLA